MGNVPEDIIPNILSRLPVKSLLRFRCVSKHWCCLIDDPDFVKMHLNHAIENEYLNLMACEWVDFGLYTVDCDTSYTKAIKLDYPYKAETSCMVLGSSNGLMYLRIGCYDIIWNSCTKEFKKLPWEPVGMDKPNPWECYHLYGFGYNPIIDDYKVVKMSQYVNDDEYICSQVMVYTLGTNSWKMVDGAPYYICCDAQLPGGNGNPHWLAVVDCNLFVPRAVVYFDLVGEKFCEIELPKCVGKVCSAGLFGGCLCLLGSLDKTRAEVWAMKDYVLKESWVKLYTIIHSTVIGSLQYLKVLCLCKNGKILLMNRFNDLILYSPKHEEAKILEVSGLPNWDDTVMYVGSLVSLKTGTFVGMKTKNKRKRKQKNRSRVEK